MADGIDRIINNRKLTEKFEEFMQFEVSSNRCDVWRSIAPKLLHKVSVKSANKYRNCSGP